MSMKRKSYTTLGVADSEHVTSLAWRRCAVNGCHDDSSGQPDLLKSLWVTRHTISMEYIYCALQSVVFSGGISWQKDIYKLIIPLGVCFLNHVLNCFQPLLNAGWSPLLESTRSHVTLRGSLQIIPFEMENTGPNQKPWDWNCSHRVCQSK